MRKCAILTGAKGSGKSTIARILVEASRKDIALLPPEACMNVAHEVRLRNADAVIVDACNTQESLEDLILSHVLGDIGDVTVVKVWSDDDKDARDADGADAVISCAHDLGINCLWLPNPKDDIEMPIAELARVLKIRS